MNHGIKRRTLMKLYFEKKNIVYTPRLKNSHGISSIERDYTQEMPILVDWNLKLY
jgi:hypothetical protein